MRENPIQPDPELVRLTKYKSIAPASADAMGQELIAFFKQSVEKRQNKFVKIADCWNTLMPVTLAEHCCLESFAAGSLTVLVDSSPHLYEMKQLLLAGLEKQLLLACKSAGLRKIKLKPGRWYDGDTAEKKVRF